MRKLSTNDYSRYWRYVALAFTFVFVAALVGVQILSAGNGSTTPEGSPSVISLPDAGRPEIGHSAPGFVLPTSNGGTPLSLASLRGGTVVLNFFYSTCPPCLGERSQLAKVAEQLEGKVTVLGIDPVDTAKNAQDFLAPAGGSIVGLLDSDWRVATAYNVLGFPTTYVIDATGTISAIHAGGVTADELDALIAKAG